MPDTIAGAVNVTSTRCAVLKVDLKGRFVYIDDETEGILGIEREDLFGRSIYDYISDRSVIILEKTLSRRNRYESFYEALPLMIRGADDRFSRFEVVVTLNFIAGNPVNYQFILIPPRNENAAETPKSEPSQSSLGEKLSLVGQIGDALQIGVLILGDTYAPLLINECLRNIFDLDQPVVNGDFESNFKACQLSELSGQALNFSQSAFAQTIKNRRFTTAEYRHTRSGKSYTVMGSPLDGDKSTEFAFYFLPGSETSEREGSLPAARRLVSSVAHDVRAPLITIEAFSRRLSRNHTEHMNKEGRFALDCLIENVGTLQHMIDGLMEMSRNWSGKFTPEDIDLGILIPELVELLKATYPDVQYRVSLPDNLPRMQTDRQRIVQLFRNLLDNAFKFSVTAKKPVIAVRYAFENDWHKFTFADNGPGITDNYRRKIFRPFFRVPDENNTSAPGTGLGLTIVQDIVTSMGGTVYLDKADGSGAVFSVNLPRESGGRAK